MRYPRFGMTLGWCSSPAEGFPLRRADRSRRPRRALLYGGAAFAALFLAAGAAVEFGPPDLRDAEFALKWRRLAALTGRQPNRPLWLVLGSSRAAMGIDAR